MANRCYLYTLDINPSEKEKADADFIDGICEWSSIVPISFKVLASANPEPCKSIIFENKLPRAILSNFEKGKDRLFDFLEKVIQIGVFDKKRLEQEINFTKEFFDEKERNPQYFLLEPGEIFELDNKSSDAVKTENLLKELTDIDSTIALYLEHLNNQKIKMVRLEQKQKSLKTDLLLNSNDQVLKTTLAKTKKSLKNLNEELWYDLAIDDWSDILYYDFSDDEE